jgi:hypothetical protein
MAGLAGGQAFRPGPNTRPGRQQGACRRREKIGVQHGFRSCFNFEPKGKYYVPDAMRAMLDQAGFEVGVYGLEHDCEAVQFWGKICRKDQSTCKSGMPLDFARRKFSTSWNGYTR